MIGDYCGNELLVSDRLDVDSEGVEIFGPAKPVKARLQYRTFSITDGNGKAVQIEAIAMVDYIDRKNLGDRVATKSDTFRIASVRLYEGLDGPEYQSWLLERAHV